MHENANGSCGRPLTHSGSYYGAASGKQDGFNLKNGAEFYLGITEMLQAMDNTIDPCQDFCEFPATPRWLHKPLGLS